MEGQGQQRLVSRSGPPTPPPNINSNRRDFVLQWGNKKRLRCVKQPHNSRFFKTTPSDSGSLRAPHSHRDKDRDLALKKQMSSSSPKKEDDKYHSTTRGSAGGFVDDDYNELLVMEGGGSARERVDKSNGGGCHVWPKLFVSLSTKEKEEDFLAMKGCKLSQRPKKRAKMVQRSLLLVSPGAWLSDLCEERYEVREKKASKRRPRGLKAMGSMGSDSD